jgi:hypothetical protein
MGGPVFLSGLIMGMITGYLVGSRGGAARRAWRDHKVAKDGATLMGKAKWPPTRAAVVAWAILLVVILTATGYFTGSQ